ncbi:BhlA/UviB family holin-like peptide [Clostridium botulinum]|nr:BhlA/UviB family holin-like peptide [Clostridium botulinum]
MENEIIKLVVAQGAFAVFLHIFFFMYLEKTVRGKDNIKILLKN